jgi:DNA-binding response OmpR family regulator
MIENPYGKHTRDDVIDNAWPEEEQREGITPNALQVHIRNIRKKIEPNPAQPCYLLTWNGRPGGYQFFPEGKPILNESLITHHDAAS